MPKYQRALSFLRYTRCKFNFHRIICRRILTGFSLITRNRYVGELVGMRERLERFVSVIPSKGHVHQLVKKLDMVLKIEADCHTHYLLFRDGKVSYCESCIHSATIITISGREAYWGQLFDGDLKLMQGVKVKYLTSDCPFRVQLVLESLFYLTRPLPV